MPTIKNPTPEQRDFLESSGRLIEEYEKMDRRGKLVPVEKSLQKKIDDQMEITAALLPGTKAREVYDEMVGEDEKSERLR